MTHYEVLGVASDAPMPVIRRAYLAAARRAHPDRPGGDGETMVRLNQAWAVLGDPVARDLYDRSIGLGAGVDPGPTAVRKPDATFRPHWSYDGAVDERPEDLDDDGDPATSPGRALQLAPVLCWVAAFAAICVALVTGLTPLYLLGVMLIVVGGAAFLITPMVAMGKAASAERAADTRRARRP